MLRPISNPEEVLGDRGVDLMSAMTLLAEKQFVYAADRRGASAYRVLSDPTLLDFLASYFRILHRRFVVSSQHQWVGLLPDMELGGWLKLPTKDTQVLLLMAVLWREALSSFGCDERGVCRTSLEIIYTRYQDLIGQYQNSPITRSQMHDQLRELHRRSLIRVHELDQEADDHEVEIRPIIDELVDDHAMARLEEFVTAANVGELMDAVEDEEQEV
ncbi:MAG: DUF4194 domain-containing protein [Parvibaculum sp.]